MVFCLSDVELESDDVLEAPIFKTMEPGEPIHKNRKLKWDHKVTQPVFLVIVY